MDGEPFINISGPGNSHLLTDLNFGDTVDARIIALGKFPCGNSIPSPPKFCYAIECQPITFNKNPDTTLCMGDSIRLKLTNIYSVSGQFEVYMNGELKGTDSAKFFLVDQGIDSERIIPKGYGKNFPVVPNAGSEEEFQMNRRTEFKVIDILEVPQASFLIGN